MSELFSRSFHQLVDSPDPAPFDPAHIPRELDRLAGLVRTGRNEEAIRLCTQLAESGDASSLAMDAMFSRLYQEISTDAHLAGSPRLTEALSLCTAGRHHDAESRLVELLRQEPANLSATLLLLRIYSRESGQAGRAFSLLQGLETKPFPRGFLDYARRSVQVWLSPVQQSVASDHGIESILVTKAAAPERESVPADAGERTIAELLGNGQLGTAFEILERQLKAQPDAFDLWLQLAEAHGRYCRNLKVAASLVARMEANPAFAPEQIETARQKLALWRDTMKRQS